jgi:nickel transport protein
VSYLKKAWSFTCTSASLALLLCFLPGSSIIPEAAAQAPPSPAREPAVASSSEQDTASTPEPASEVDCQQVITSLRQQQSLIVRETGQLKRELAALRQDVSKPGIKEIFAGIGYIFGLAGVGLYVQSRKRRES